jgi:trimeric autotransporter adhesin
MKLTARIGMVLFIVTQLSLIANAQSGIITTYAGPGAPVSGSFAKDQAIDGPTAIISDRASGLYIAVGSQNQVYQVTANGKIILIAGIGTPGFSGDGGPATAAQLFNPIGLAADSAGNLFIADSSNSRIRKVSPDGTISTAAGNGTAGHTGDGGQATSAELNQPWGLAFDILGNLLVSDSANHCIRKVTGSTISNVAGTGIAGFSGDDSAATSAKLNRPTGLAVDTTGNLFITDTANQSIREITIDGYIHTIAGSGTQGFDGDGKQATSAKFNFPAGLALDGAGNLFVADSGNYRIRKITSDGGISTIAGAGTAGFSGDGGAATKAEFDLPMAVMVDAAGNLFIADYVNRRIRMVTTSGVVSTSVGTGTAGFSGDGGQAGSAHFTLPAGVALDSKGNLFIADSSNSRIRVVAPSGVIKTMAGTGNRGFGGDGGQATAADLYGPVAMAVDASGNLFISDYLGHCVRKVTSGGIISTIAGTGSKGFSGDDGPATSAQLNQPWGIAVDVAGNLFIADLVNHRVRKVTPGGVINTIAGMGIPGYSGDGAPATAAQLTYPTSVAIDTAGNLFIADSGNHRIRKVAPGGVISTVAGNGIAGFSGDGDVATGAQLNRPTSVTLDSAGNLYIADHDNNRIRKIASDGVIYTVAGIGSAGFSGDGGPAISAQINSPMSIASDSAGNLFVADYGNNRIRKVSPANSTAYFPQFAAGNGYSTLFVINNTGSGTASGSLALTDPKGNPLAASAHLITSAGIVKPAMSGSSFSIEVPAGKTVSLLMDGLTEDRAQGGWGQLTTTKGSLAALAVYEYLVGSRLQTVSGALQSPLLQSATIAVDNDSSQGKMFAYAIANPSDQAISIRMTLVEPDGTVTGDTVWTLGPNQQMAKYLSQDLECSNFHGSLVLQGQAEASFIAIALIDKQGILMAIPLISGRDAKIVN